MITLTKEFRFEASHQLMHHDGKCARLHGHSWIGRAILKFAAVQTEGPKQGMAMDYADIKTPIQAMLDNYLDHWHLNDTLGVDSPTSEYVAQFVFEHLRRFFPANLVAVEIDETCTTSCRYE